MGVYRYLLSGKKRSVAIEKYNGVWMDQHERDIHETPSEWNKEDLQNQSNPYYPKQKPTLMLFPFAYKLGFGDDAWMGWKGRKEVAASKAADKEYQNWIDAGENSIVWNWCGYESEFSSVRFTLPVSHLCVLADSWDDVKIGDEVYTWDGRSGWTDTTPGMRAYGYIVGKRGNGQFVIGTSYHDPNKSFESTTITDDGRKVKREYKIYKSVKSWKELEDVNGHWMLQEGEDPPRGLFHHDERIIVSEQDMTEPKPEPKPEAVEIGNSLPWWYR